MQKNILTQFSIGHQFACSQKSINNSASREPEWEICVDKGTWGCFVFTVSVYNATPLHARGRSLRSARVRTQERCWGFHWIFFIVVRCIARSTKLLRREVRICAMFRNVERRVGGSLRMKPQSHQGKIHLFKHRWVAPAAALVTTTGLDLLKCTSYINYQIFTSKRRSENYYLKITGTHLIMVFLLKRLTLNRNQGA